MVLGMALLAGSDAFLKLASQLAPVGQVMMMLSLGGTALFLTALPALAEGTEDQVTSFSLDNGMEVVVIEDHRAPVVVQMVWYRVGGADDPAGQSGIAHYLEHLMFKATDDIPAGEFSKIVARNGGQDNAFTSWDYTAYYQRVAKDRLEKMMSMEAERMTDLILTKEEVYPERDVVKEERRQRIENNPGSILFEKMMAALYPNHPYGIPVIGFMDEVAALDIEDAKGPDGALLHEAGISPVKGIYFVGRPWQRNRASALIMGAGPDGETIVERLLSDRAKP